MSKLIMMRHGQSVWNKKNRFTGWVDIPLSEKGINEAIKGGKKIKNIPIDVIFISSLIRAQLTAFLAMIYHCSGKVPVLIHVGEGKLAEWSKIYDEKAREDTIPVYSSWHLNERYYGHLQGLDKDETRKKYGPEQVKIWRRSFDERPPEGESLAMTAKRTIPYFEKEVVKFLKEGKNVFLSAHGNSLRAIVMLLDNLSKEEVLHLEIATGDPLVYEYKNGIWTKEKV